MSEPVHDQKPTLLFVTPYFAPACHGGAVQIYLGLLKRLTGYRIVVVSDRYGASDEECARWDDAAQRLYGFSVERIDSFEFHAGNDPARDLFAKFILRPVKQALDLIHYFQHGRRQWAEHLSRYKPRLIVCGGTYWASWLMTGMSRKIRLLNYIHGEELTMQVKPRILQPAMRYWQRRCIEAADMNVVVSSYTLQLVRKSTHVQRENLRILPNFIDLKRFYVSGKRSDLRKVSGWDGKLVFLTIARLEKRKGIDQVIRALSYLEMQERLPKDWIYVVGGRGPEKEPLLQLAKDLEIDERIIFRGFVPDEEVPILYESSDLFLQPNREIDGDTEGFGVVFLEASACGTPVIGGKAGGTADAISEGISGFRVNGDSVTELADAIERLANDAQLRNRIAAQGVEWAKQFDVEKAALMFQATVDELLNK